MLRKSILALLILLGTSTTWASKNYDVQSPDGKLVVKIQKSPLSWTVEKEGRTLYTMQDVSMIVAGKTLAGGATPKSIKVKMKEESIKPVVALKYSEIQSKYNEVVLNYGTYQVEMRIFDNAVTYRFSTKMKEEVEVTEDNFTFIPSEEYMVHRQPCNSFTTNFEDIYLHSTMEEWNKHEQPLSTIPLLLSGENDLQLLMGEANVDNYPRIFLTPKEKGISPTYPKALVSWEPKGHRDRVNIQEGDFIAKTSGTRTFPWRYVTCTNSKGLVEQTITLQLSPKPAIEDTSWIHPGKVSWEWWSGAAPYGPDVTFRYGNNYDTYAYYADFAAKYGIEYILLDSGWAQSHTDPFTTKPDLRLKELIAHAKSKGVKLILWLPWLTVEQHFDLFKTYAEWGIAGVKIDYMDHVDQEMVNFYKRVAEEATKNHLLVDFHGSMTPMGLEYEYPNVLSFEGVRGLEQNGSCKPENTLFIPFIRNAVGPADFTPGGLFNMQPDQYTAKRPNTGAIGTRCFQMALYVVLESGIQMLADNPTRYYEADECTRYIASVPTTWDETRCLDAVMGKYIVVAKRKGTKWFLGAICNEENAPLTLHVKLDFLNEGSHQLKGFKDGSNADFQAMHYNKVEQQVDKNTTLEIVMVKNGGFAAVIE